MAGSTNVAVLPLSTQLFGKKPNQQDELDEQLGFAIGGLKLEWGLSTRDEEERFSPLSDVASVIDSEPICLDELVNSVDPRVKSMLLRERDEMWRAHERSQILYLQREHEKMLKGLHHEIDRLQKLCRSLSLNAESKQQLNVNVQQQQQQRAHTPTTPIEMRMDGGLGDDVDESVDSVRKSFDSLRLQCRRKDDQLLDLQRQFSNAQRHYQNELRKKDEQIRLLTKENEWKPQSHTSTVRLQSAPMRLSSQQQQRQSFDSQLLSGAEHTTATTSAPQHRHQHNPPTWRPEARLQLDDTPTTRLLPQLRQQVGSSLSRNAAGGGGPSLSSASQPSTTSTYSSSTHRVTRHLPNVRWSACALPSLPEFSSNGNNSIDNIEKPSPRQSTSSFARRGSYRSSLTRSYVSEDEQKKQSGSGLQKDRMSKSNSMG